MAEVNFSLYNILENGEFTPESLKQLFDKQLAEATARIADETRKKREEEAKQEVIKDNAEFAASDLFDLFDAFDFINSDNMTNEEVDSIVDRYTKVITNKETAKAIYNIITTADRKEDHYANMLRDFKSMFNL